MTAPTDALIERYGRWLQNIGYDGGPDSPPMRMLAAYKSNLARIEAAENALEDALGANNLAADPLERARFYAANPLREDSIVREICEHHGYGAVMDSASRQWLTRDEDGVRGAFVVGTCYATWVRAREALRAAAQWQAGQEGEG